MLPTRHLTKKEAISKFVLEWKEVVEDEVVAVKQIDKTIVMKGRLVTNDSTGKKITSQLSVHQMTKSAKIRRETNTMKKKNRVNQQVIKFPSTQTKKGEIIIKDEEMIKTIVNTMIKIKSIKIIARMIIGKVIEMITSKVIEMITSKVIDKSTTKTKIIQMDNINVNTNQKEPMKTVQTILKIESTKEKILISQIKLMTLENNRNSLKIVDSMPQKTKEINSRRMWIQATKKFIRKWKIKPRRLK